MHIDPSQPYQDKEELEKAKKRLLQMLLEEEGFASPEQEIISPRDRAQKPAISFAQERMWFLSQWDTGHCLYNIPIAVRLRGSLQVKQLERSLNEVVRRHEVLRSTFSTASEGPILQIVHQQELLVPMVDLRSTPIAEQEELVRSLAKTEAAQPFNLTQGPLLRSVLVCLADDDFFFILVFHHICFDDWSVGIFLHELSTLYTVFCEGKSSSLSDLPIQYPDFSAWQRQYMQGELYTNLLAYWQQKLAGELPLLHLPTDYPRPAVATYQGKYQSLTLSSALSTAIKKLSKREGTTPFMTLLTAYTILLYRYTEQDDILIGSPVVNRDRAAVDKLIGYFGNMVALRLHVTGTLPFLALLRHVQHICVEAFAHQDLPFEKLVEELRPERNTSQTPLFQTVFSFRTDAHLALQLKDVQATFLEIERNSARFDLAMEILDTGECLAITLNYKTDLFQARTTERMLGHFQELLEEIVAQPTKDIANLSLLTAKERVQILEEWNATDRVYSLDTCIHLLFEQRVIQTPNMQAIIAEDRSLTYHELNQQANQLAHYLQRLGVGPNVPVGICIERSPDVIVGLLSILKAGGVFLLLDPSYPSERLQFMLDDAQVFVLLTQQRYASQIGVSQKYVVSVDTEWPIIAQESDRAPLNTTIAENGAYAIYTSGSTGTPKGVVISHKSLCNRILAVCDMLNVTAQDRFLQKTPYAFDVAIGEILTPLLAGATLVIAKPEGHWNPQYLLEVIVQNHITYIHFVPSMLSLFLEQDLDTAKPYLRHVWCGGEALSPELRKRFFQRLHAKLYNGYGPSETTIGVACQVYTQDSEGQNVSIGIPMANTCIYILDSALNLLPIGVAGELYIGGVQLAKGYLRRPELTQERFIPNPFSKKADAQLYKTGDLARYLHNGAIEFLGRIDNQVKLRGVRIELSEIEAVLTLYPTIRQVVVLAREDVPSNKYLAAYLVPTSDIELEVHELRMFLQKKLPVYMIPATFTVMKMLPLMENGKVDLAKLPVPVRERTIINTMYVMPSNQIERVVASIWCEVLGVEKVGVHDNFFDLGGHSLLIFQVQRKLLEILSKELSIVDLFQATTVSTIAHLINHGKEERTDYREKIQLRAEKQRKALLRGLQK